MKPVQCLLLCNIYIHQGGASAIRSVCLSYCL